MQGQTGSKTSCEGSLVPQNQSYPFHISTTTTSAYFWAQMEEKLFLEGTHTALGGGDLGVWHSQPIQTPAWQPGATTQHSWGQVVITPCPVGLFAQLMDALPSADGNMQPGQSPWVDATCTPAVAVIAASTSVFFWLFFRFPRSGDVVAEMQKTHPQVFFVSVHTLLPPAIGCPPIPLTWMRAKILEWFYPHESRKVQTPLLKSLLGGFQIFFFFIKAKCLATLWESIQVHGSLPEGALKLFQGRIVSSAQSLCAVMLVNLHPIYVPEKQDYHPSQTGMKWPSLSFSFDSWNFFQFATKSKTRKPNSKPSR